MRLAVLVLCILLAPVATAAEGVEIPRDQSGRDAFDVLQPDWAEADEARVHAQQQGSAIVYVFTTGIQARDGFWTSDAVAAADAVPVVKVAGTTGSPLAKAWNVREFPALVAADWHDNVWARLEGKAVKPATVQQLMVHAKGLVTRTREQMTTGIAEAVAQSEIERKIPAAIASLKRYAAVSGLPEAAQAQAALDGIVARGLDELRELAQLMAEDPPAARRALPGFERRYAGTALVAQAARVREGRPIDLETPASEPAAAGDDGGQIDLFGGQ